MASITTLAVIAALCCSALANPILPTTPPPETTENSTATNVSANTSAPASSRLPDSFKTFLTVHPPDDSFPIAFHVQLNCNVTLEDYAKIELQNYRIEPKPGQFYVGKASFDPIHGTFTSPTDAVFHFTAQVYFFNNQSQEASEEEDFHVSVAICINGDCESNAALQSTTGLLNEHFSILVTGELQTEKDQVLSVFVENSSERRLMIDESSSFMGYSIITEDE